MKERSYRRWRRYVAIQHAFKLRYYDWDCQNDWQNWHYTNHEKVVGVNKWECQDENRQYYLGIATRVADRLATCSCSMCKNYWPKDRTPHDLKHHEEEKVDREYLKEYLNGQNSL